MAEPDRTNAAAERVSDMLRIIATALNKGPTESANARQGMALRCSQAADIIEAQSKALAEAMEWLIELQNRIGSLSWWSLTDTYGDGGYFTGDSSKALRFARREDAQAYIDDAGWTEARPMPFSALTPSPENSNA